METVGQVLYEMHSKVLIFLNLLNNRQLFILFYSWVNIWNDTFKENTLNCTIIHPFCVIPKLSWHRNKVKNANKMNVCNYEPIWTIGWHFSMYYGLAKWRKYIFKKHLQCYPYKWCKLCTCGHWKFLLHRRAGLLDWHISFQMSFN